MEEGCWLDHVADSRKLAIAPMASSHSGGNDIIDKAVHLEPA